MAVYLEHANLTVRDLDEAIRFLRTAIPEFSVRHRDIANGREWAHVGNAETYIALTAAPERAGRPEAYEKLGVNHIGFVVEDARAVARALREAGFREGMKADPHPYRHRIYFHDADDNEWEFVEYFTDRLEQRNDYSQ
jgi:catechol 2,3-dioxygenase-like lactoylglutathione lyase family enzyme